MNDLQKKYILSQGDELFSFLMANLDCLESVSHLLSKHWNSPHRMAMLVRQQIDVCLNEEPEDVAQRRIYGE